MENLKDYREKELKNYFIGNILILLFSLKRFYEVFLAVIPSSAANDTNVVNLLIAFLTSAFVSLIIYIYLFILDSLFIGDFKTSVCNLWRTLPGEIIFEDIKKSNKDKRFARNAVENKYSEIYLKLNGLHGKEKKQYSNSAWYDIYKKHKDESMIFVANRDYLLCRDICFSTLFIILIYVILVIFGFSFFSWKYLVFLCLELALSNIAMRSKGSRLAYNVIAADI